MKRFLRRLGVLAIALAAVELTKHVAGWSEWYGRAVYPTVSHVLTLLFGWLPFSLYDLLIASAVIALLTGIVCLFRRRLRRRAAEALVLGAGWLYVAFYALWGFNYFAPSFLARNGLQPAQFDEAKFKAMLTDYTDSLNAAYADYAASPEINLDIDSLIRADALRLGERLRFPALAPGARTKPMLYGRLYAATGVRGYYGPFTGEAQVSSYASPIEMPALHAHELSHAAGVAHEAEANLFAYLLTTASDVPAVRLSGYLSILTYMAANARSTLSEADYTAFVDSIAPGARDLYTASRQRWGDLYSPTLGLVQDKLYEFYLRNNNIPSGQKNYFEVVGLLMALREAGYANQR
jgi:hypothetical protein